jgi:hypothetical protein
MLSTQLWHAEFFTRPMAVRVPRQADVALADAPVDAADTLIPLEAQ